MRSQGTITLMRDDPNAGLQRYRFGEPPLRRFDIVLVQPVDTNARSMSTLKTRFQWPKGRRRPAVTGSATDRPIHENSPGNPDRPRTLHPGRP